MATEIRYAVRRDEVTAANPRTWWWHTTPKESFESRWEDRRIMEQAEALAVLWRHRSTNSASVYRFVLVRITRTTPDTTVRPPVEERIP